LTQDFDQTDPGKPGKERNMKKFYVLTYMDSNQDTSETAAFYQGEFEFGEFPARVAYWHDQFLVVPNWFDTEEAAKRYIQDIKNQTPGTYYMVQERHYAEGDPRIAHAKIITDGIPNDFYIQPSRGKTQERDGEPMIDVWTMYFFGEHLAEQYVNAFNRDIRLAISVRKAG
jgi:hypothetical protein